MTRVWRKLLAGLALATAMPAMGQDTVLVENIGPDGDIILAVDGTITFAGPLADMPPIGGARLIDAGGAYALPGLIDMHVHIWGEAELAAYLAHGVTTVRNLSGMPFHLRMAKAVETGELEGPRLLTSGPILNSPGPNAQINHQIVQSEEDGRDAVRRQHQAGFRRIKTYSNLTADAYRGILGEARRLDMAITGHTPEGERLAGIPDELPFQIAFADVLDDQFETIEHTESVFFHGLNDLWDAQAAQALASAIAEAGVPVTPTLVAHRNLVRVAQSGGAFARRPGMELLNPVTQQIEAEGIAFWSGQDPAFESQRADQYSQLTAMMQDEGVLLVAGSDAGIFANIPGLSLIDELEMLVEAGLTPQQAIAAATTNAAKAMGKEGRLGCLEAGCAADIVFYACDPGADIACLRNPAALSRAGRWYDQRGLAYLHERAARHDVPQIVSDILAGMAAQGTPLDPAMLGM